MPHVLGIDIGPARTHAATRRRHSGQWTDPEPLWLGETTPATATALFLDDEGYLITGDAAVREGAAVPSRLMTGFHRRIGDDVPVFVGGTPFTPESLTTVVVEAVADLAGNGPPRHLVVTHPGDWGGYRRELLRRTLTGAGFPAVTLVPSAVAALHAHLPDTGQGERTAAVCEFGPDGVTVTLATSAATTGWFSRNSTEGVAPTAALSSAFSLAQSANVAPEALSGIVFCGDPGPGALPGRLPCPVFAGPQPALTAALGAATLAAHRTATPAQQHRVSPRSTGPRPGTAQTGSPVDHPDAPGDDLPALVDDRPGTTHRQAGDLAGPNPRTAKKTSSPTEKRPAVPTDGTSRRPRTARQPGDTADKRPRTTGRKTGKHADRATTVAQHHSGALTPHGAGDPAQPEPAAAETILLPRVDDPADLPERPERPPVEITPFELPEPEGFAKLFRRWRPLAAAAAVLAIAASVLIAIFSSHPATADRQPGSPPPPAPSSCNRPATAPTGEGHC
ncbi:Hsp70 family protein [Amycolatopsis panacis]|uniref:molecular chaperone DnaK n=1 Tax=Amycolatopsis panacis TaxID=2340917 RepID=UPI0018F36B7C|nr:molecular chaperone DnaK [Amycolatopsis panacis]